MPSPRPDADQYDCHCQSANSACPIHAANAARMDALASHFDAISLDSRCRDALLRARADVRDAQMRLMGVDIALRFAPAQGPVPALQCRTAEAAKLLENVFRSVNIALVNELKGVYAAMDIDVWEVIAAARNYRALKSSQTPAAADAKLRAQTLLREFIELYGARALQEFSAQNSIVDIYTELTDFPLE